VQWEAVRLTTQVPASTVALPLNKGTSGEGRGRKATGPRFLRGPHSSLTPRGPPTAELPERGASVGDAGTPI